jgi:hypothetical protein
MYGSIAQRSVCLVALVILVALVPRPALACSCVKGSSKWGANDVKRAIRHKLLNYENVAWLRATDVQVVRNEEGRDEQRVVFRVIKSWKGKARGELVQVVTPNYGGSMCEMWVELGQEIFIAFDAVLSPDSCTTSSRPTHLERQYLDALSPRYRKKRSRISDGE